MKEIQKLKLQLKEQLSRLEDWNKRVDNKEILSRNTKEEIDELYKDILREVIMPLIAKITWLELNM